MNHLDDVLSKRHLPALDGLRAVAVGVVIWYHAGEMFGLPPYIPGDLGVSFFFVLSGFLITLLLNREKDETGTVSLRNFYARRTLRIFPAYYVFVLLWLGLYIQLHGFPKADLLGSAFGYLMNYYNAFNGHPSNGISHAWSLAVEEQFYLIWPAVFLWLVAQGRRIAMEWLLLVTVVAVLAWRSFAYLVLGFDTAYVYNAFEMRFDSLAIGCILAVLCKSKKFTLLARVLATSPFLPIVTIVLIAVSRVGISDAWHYSVGFTVDALLMAVLIAQLLQLSDSRGWNWLNYPAEKYLGVISYPLYLYHEWAIFAAKRMPIPLLLQISLALCLSVALASGSYWFVEKPFLRLKKRFSGSSNGQAKDRFEGS